MARYEILFARKFHYLLIKEKKMKRLLILILILILSQSGWARDAGSFATKNFFQIEEEVQKLFQLENPQNVLVVFDIDNTLLKLPQDFGSEQWFMWQKELIEKKYPALPAVTDSVVSLLTIQSWIYNLSSMQLVVPDQAQWINALRNSGVSVITLTSRSLSVHDSTLREIKNNNLSLSTASDLGLDLEGQPYLPYIKDRPNESGLEQEDISRFKLGEANQVLFDKGVFFTQGQHKGIMLKTLLARMGKSFRSIIFIDDRSGHIEAMRLMAQTIPQDIYSIHFNLSEDWTLPFLKGPKEIVENNWCLFSDWLNSNWFLDSSSRIYRSCK